MEDLVGVRVADARDELLVAEQVLQFAMVSPNPRPPDLEGQCRVVRVRTLGRVQAGNVPVHSGWHEVDLAHLGRVAIANLR